MVMGATKFEQLFRKAGRLDVDKSDLGRLSEFLNRKVHDPLLAAQGRAKSDARDLIETRDLPVTKGLQESIQEFRKLDVELELEPILKQLAELPPLDLDLTEEARRRLPEVVGGIAVSLANTFPILDPEVKNPET